MRNAVMTAGEAVAAVRDRWPTAREDSEILALLLNCENFVRLLACGMECLDTLDASTVLAVPSPFDMVYIHYVAANLAQLDGETARYNEEITLFYARWNDLVAAYRRKNLPEDRCAVGFVNRGVKV